MQTATFTLDPIARWESKSGKHWVDLYTDGVGAWYKASDCGGSLGKIRMDTTLEAAQAELVSTFQKRVDSGYFQPDANITPMRRIK
jgi:hypothetical protein